jgi:hypothetical protein
MNFPTAHFRQNPSAHWRDINIAPIMKNRTLSIVIFAKNNCAANQKRAWKRISFKRKLVLRFLLWTRFWLVIRNYFLRKLL